MEAKGSGIETRLPRKQDASGTKNGAGDTVLRMKAFFVRWRSAAGFREFELFADVEVGAALLDAVEASGGLILWQAGTLWRCPGCGDRTVQAGPFLEGLRRAEGRLTREEGWRETANDPDTPARREALAWIATAAAHLAGCEREKVYIKDDGADCTFAGQTYLSRV